MIADKTESTRRMPDFLLSWDRLGFRLLVFGGLALAWILQGLLAGLPWQKLVLTEVGGLMPWAFLTPMVLALDRRIQSKRLGAGGFLGAHLLGMVLVFVPYWLIAAHDQSDLEVQRVGVEPCPSSSRSCRQR